MVLPTIFDGSMTSPEQSGYKAPEEESFAESFEEEEPNPPVRAIGTIIVVLFVVIVVGFVWYATRFNVAPEKECAYRGGVWLIDERSCVFESVIRGGSEQVGMKSQTITILIPDTHPATEVTFANVEIGAPHAKTLPIDADGSIGLISELGRVQKETKDLVMPFAVGQGAAGIALYMGLFESRGENVYVLSDAEYVGDRVSAQALSLSALEKGAVFTARFLYRDRREGEAYSEIPTEPRTFELAIRDHRIVRALTMGREGVFYKDLVRITTPLPHTHIAPPLTIQGTARGPWYFEGSFPVLVVDGKGAVIAQGVAQASTDWMTEDWVPFTATVAFTHPDDVGSGDGLLIIRKDNPSGLPEHDDSFEIPISFALPVIP